jgi:FtsH-binding integral membrane protein
MSHMTMIDQRLAILPASEASLSDRLSFIRKTYLMAGSGVATFFAVVAFVILGAAAGFGPAQMLLKALFAVPPLLMFFIILGAAFGAQRLAHVPGIGAMVFYLYSALLGLITVPLVGYAVGTKGLMIIPQALGITVLAFGGLTAYVFITRKDFSLLGGFLAVGMMLLLGAVGLTLLAGLFGYDAPNYMHIGFSLLAGLIFMGYVLYDTGNILHNYATDMVVPAAMALMVDFVMLFRVILSLLASRN